MIGGQRGGGVGDENMVTGVLERETMAATREGQLRPLFQFP